MDSNAPPTQIGKYRVLSELGRGGMGVVYRAEDRFIGREVAIKTLVDATPEMRERFALEARSGVLNHQNIVTVYDFGEHEGNPYIVMEFLHGQTLDKIIKENQPFSLADKLDIARQICEGLGYAHSRGVIHRDIKPANIVVQANGCVKLVDFGIAQLETLSGQTVAGAVIGTYQYLSPERLKGEVSDGRADIWSAGVVLYLLLTGTLPFPGEDISALHRVITDPYPPLGSMLPTSYPQSLDNIVARALAKDPAQRYPNAFEMAGDLEATRDAIRLSRVEDLLEQARNLLERKELLRARPLLLDLQRLAPQNTAVRNLLRELAERLNQPPELRTPAAPANGHGQSTTTPQPPSASSDEQRRERIIEQIVAEIRTQAERGHEARALELVHRSLERAPNHPALLALQTHIQAMMQRPETAADPVLPAAVPEAQSAADHIEPQVLAEPAPQVVAEPQPELVASLEPEDFARPEPTAEPEAIAPAVLGPEPGHGRLPDSHSLDSVAEFRIAEAVPVEQGQEAIELPNVTVEISGVHDTLEPLPEGAIADPAPFPEALSTSVDELPRAVEPNQRTAAAVSVAEPVVVAAAPSTELVTPAPVPVAGPPTTAPVSETTEGISSVQKPVPAASWQRPAAEAVPAAASVRPAAPAKASAPVRATGKRPTTAILGAVAAVLLLVALFFGLRHHGSSPTAPAVASAQIVASPYATVLQMSGNDGQVVVLPAGDHTTPLQVEGLQPGRYTLKLQQPDGATSQAQCDVKADQPLCFIAPSPLGDGDVQAILAGGAHP